MTPPNVYKLKSYINEEKKNFLHIRVRLIPNSPEMLRTYILLVYGLCLMVKLCVVYNCWVWHRSSFIYQQLATYVLCSSGLLALQAVKLASRTMVMYAANLGFIAKRDQYTHTHVHMYVRMYVRKCDSLNAQGRNLLRHSNHNHLSGSKLLLLVLLPLKLLVVCAGCPPALLNVWG